MKNSVQHLYDAQEHQDQIYKNMPYHEKWQQALLLRQTAWTMKRAYLTDRHPDWTSEQVEAELRKIFLYAST